jgi:hypothetical protein
MNTIFCLYGLNKLEPGLYKRWVFAGNSLAIVRTAPALRELRCTLDKVVNPVLANRLLTPLSQQSISHISHKSLRWQYST